MTAAEAVLAHQHYVSAVDVLMGIGFLQFVHFQSWKKGRVGFLEETIQAGQAKIRLSTALFREWAVAKGLTPSETRYVRLAPGGPVELRFSESGNPDVERNYRTHYLSPEIPAKEREKLEEKLSAPEKPVVFQVLRDSECSECGTAIDKGDFLMMEAERPLCLPCAGFGDEFEYLPAGDAALTRRATKYSGRSVVVVRFSRSRGRYERRGIFLETTAIERAEQECTLDADARARDRAVAAVRRQDQDRELVAQMTQQIERLFPGCSRAEASDIAAHTAVRGSDRVGRSAAGRELQDGALTAAVLAAIRHRHTNYDALLLAGVDRHAARERVAEQVNAVLTAWRHPG